MARAGKVWRRAPNPHPSVKAALEKYTYRNKQFTGSKVGELNGLFALEARLFLLFYKRGKVALLGTLEIRPLEY